MNVSLPCCGIVRYFALLLILIGFTVTAFADDTQDNPESTSELDCNYPICLLEDKNYKKSVQGSDFVIKVQVEPETKFTARVFDTKYELAFIESIFADKDGIARIVYPIPNDAKNGNYEVTYTSYTSKGAIHSGLLLQLDDGSALHDETRFKIHAHMYRHDNDHLKPIVINEPIHMGISTNYKFGNDTNIPFEFTIFDPNGKIIDKGTIVNKKERMVRHTFVTEIDGMHTVTVKSDIKGFEEHSEKFGVLKSEYIIHENNRDYQVLVRSTDESTVAINNMYFDKDEKQIIFELEPTWYFRDMLIVELPYGLLDGPYDIIVDGQLQHIIPNGGYPGGVHQRGDFTSLSVPLEYNSTKVQIVGTTVFPEVSQELTVNLKILEYEAGETLTIHGTSLPEEELHVKMYTSDGIPAFSDRFTSGLYGTFEYNVMTWPKHSADFPEGKYTVEISNPEGRERLKTIEVKFQNKSDLFSRFQHIPIKDQMNYFEIQPTKISCKDGTVLVIKDKENSPACVFSATAEKLSQRGGWTVVEHKIEVNWLDSYYASTDTGIVRIMDSHMNISVEDTDYFDIYVWSDSDPEGIEIKVTETGKDTDTFEGTVLFSNSGKSSEGALYASTGDSVKAFHKDVLDLMLLTNITKSDMIKQSSSYVIIPKGAAIEGNEHLIPKVITVVLGVNNTITWINRDDTGHGIASDDASWGSPGILKPGESFSVTFDSTGDYDYHGQPGPWITGKVIVLNADSFSVINRQGTFYKDSKDSEKFEEYRILMQEKQKDVASHVLDIPISNAYVVEGWNFPFRDVSEITQMVGTDPVAICNIPEKIPTHLQKIHESDMFQMFAEKYSQHQLTVDISDERYSGGLVHYDLIATSDDGLFTARTYFHLDSCTDNMKWPYFLLCKDVRNEEHVSTRIKSEIISSIENDEFCNIDFEPWHQDLRNYQAMISKEIDTLTQGGVPTDSQGNASYRYFLDVQRLGLLNDIIRYYESENSDQEKMRENVAEYNKKFGNLPDELLDIIEQRK